MRAFLEALPRSAVVADVGCGNGKYFGVRRDAAMLGCDRSAGLAALAARRAAPSGLPGLYCPAAGALVADGLCLPYRTGCCDAAISVAVLHHVASATRRTRMIEEMLRLLRPGGRLLITVWAKEQEEPRRTLDKWTPFDAGGGGDGGGASGGGAAEEDAAAAAAAAAATAEAGVGQGRSEGSSGGSSGSTIGEGESNAGRGGGDEDEEEEDAAALPPPAARAAGATAASDYLVPWHLPFHRAGAAPAAAAAAAAAAADTSRETANSGGNSGSGGGAPAAATAQPGGRLDAAKRAVVFQRYYHLFDRTELEALVRGARGARLVASFYDRSNWCAIAEKV